MSFKKKIAQNKNNKQTSKTVGPAEEGLMSPKKTASPSCFIGGVFRGSLKLAKSCLASDFAQQIFRGKKWTALKCISVALKVLHSPFPCGKS